MNTMSRLELLEKLLENDVLILQGRTLMTRITQTWPAEKIRENDESEARHVFRNFFDEDEGRSRQLVATFEDAKDARAYVMLKNMAAELIAATRERDVLKSLAADYIASECESAFNAGGLRDDGMWPRVWVSDARWLASHLDIEIRGGPYVGGEIVKAMASVPDKIIAAQIAAIADQEGKKA
jgi:hypothetical protein